MSIGERQDDWDQWLALAEFCHNNSQNARVGKAPFKVVYGHLPRLQISSNATKVPRVEDHAKELEKIYAEANAAISIVQMGWSTVGGEIPVAAPIKC